ncbi:MAG: T9SS type A sorting domain-containing protein, partial [Bacteroidetes bacterium]|nr:T9SS type A sorting domain-containing protein [Bacteroidota bacterium]
GAGFVANYTSTGTASCDGLTLLTDYSGSLDDGSGLNNYGNNQICYWLIAPPGATSITLSFDSFKTELNYDGVIVLDGDSLTASILGVFTGSSLPANVTSTGGSMLIMFLSDYSITSDGFEANYTATGTPYCNDTTLLIADAGWFDDGSGSGPDYYNNTECNWLIQPSGADSIKLYFIYFDVEDPYANFIFDALEVYDGIDTTSTLLGRFTGSNIPPDLTSSGSSMFIRFYSDYSIADEGWEIFYTSLSPPFCSGIDTLTVSTGTISEGSGANDYANNSSCMWLLQPIGATSINLSFTSFDTEQNFDWVVVYDGADTTASILGSFSGTTLPSSISSTGGSMLVWFLSDESFVQGGFSANYSSVITSIYKFSNSYNGIFLYPNPTSQTLFCNYDFDYDLGDYKIQIYNTLGQIVFKKDLKQRRGTEIISTNEFPNGVYQFSVTKGNLLVFNEKIIVVR